MEVINPLCNAKILYEKSIASSLIIEKYKQEYAIDISDYLCGINNIDIYRCTLTGYRFYYPFSVSGDGKFYELLQDMPGYYLDWKWEHEVAKKIVKSSDKVLEIGCAKGSFLNEVSKKGVQSVGLELNESAILVGKNKGLSIYNQTIQEHALMFPEKYDVICSFQVMEHIADIGEVIQSSLKALRKNGTLIISVPNNETFMNFENGTTLNFPPHHMGLWNTTSLTNLQKVFDVKLMRILYEPLQLYHYHWYYYVKMRKLIMKYGFWGKVVNNLSQHNYEFILNLLRNNIKGHSIMAIYSKR